MPYIKQEDRPGIGARVAHNPGELNYKLTRECVHYMDAQTKSSGMAEPSYAIIAEAIGALECAKLELYARIARPYEDRKRVENGDVYDAQSL
jgi:hypothetical protein